MANVGLEISDVGLMAAGGAHPSVLKVDGDRSESPGVALQVKKRLVLGWAAKRQERLYPRQCTDRFWSLLSTEPLQERSVDVASYAEVALAHLDAVSRSITIPDPVWAIAVPEFLDPGKLGVLLGVAKALGLSVEGFVANAVAAVRPQEIGRSTVHVDVHLHRIELTLVDQEERIRRARSYLITDSGWERLEDQVARRLADEFVQATRFDPLHEAAAEQELYDRIPALMQGVADGEPVSLELKLGRSMYRISVSSGMVAEACDPLCRKVLESLAGIRDDAADRALNLDVQLSHRAARVPGLLQALRLADGVDVSALPEGAGALGALRMGAEFVGEPGGEGADFLSSRARPRSKPSPPPGLPGDDSQATHVLLGSKAYPFRDHPLWILRSPAGLEAASAPDVHAGETVCCVRMQDGRVVVEPPDAEVQLISVQSSRET